MSDKRRRVGNIAALVATYGAGQGALFAAQTALIARGQLAWLGGFGTAFVFITLFYQIVDLGGLTLLAREILDETRSASEKWRLFWSFSAVRAVLAIAVAAMAIVIFLFIGPKFWTLFFLTSTLGLLAIAFNPGGMLDGLSRSGWNGVAGALPFLAIASTLLISSRLHDRSLGGAILGLAYSAGSLAGVGLQFVILRRHFEYRGARYAEWAKGLALAREGVIYSLSWMPGQLFFRGQIAISASLFGPAATGLLVYAKQILTAASQVVYFARRAEFPNLVKQLTASTRKITTAFKSQKFSLALAVLEAIIICLLTILLKQHLPTKFQNAAILTACFMPALLASSALTITMQASVALRQVRFAAEANIIALLVVGLIVSFLLAKLWQLFGIAAAECISNLLTTAVIVARMRFAERETETTS